MSMKCNRPEEMIDRLFSQDAAKLNTADLEHAVGCQKCDDMLKKIERFESMLGKEFEEFKKTLPQIRFKFPIENPYAKKVSEQTPTWDFDWSSIKKYFVPFAFTAAAAVLILIIAFPIWNKPSVAPVRPKSDPITIATNSNKDLGMILSGSLILSDGKKIDKGASFVLNAGVIRCFSVARIKLPSTVEIEARDARFRFDSSGILLDRGTIEIIVAKKGTRFSAVTPTAVLGVRGTQFKVVYLDDKITRVSVSEGTVHVAAIGGQERLLKANETAAVDGKGLFQDEEEPTIPLSDIGSETSKPIASPTFTPYSVYGD